MATSRANPEADGARNICKGCGYPGAYPSDLKRHLQAFATKYARVKPATLLRQNKPCRDYYRRSRLGNAALRLGRRARPTVAVSARAGEGGVQQSLISPARLHVLRAVPEHLAEDRLFEILRDGLVGRPLRDCCDWVGGLPFVNAWVEGHACDTMATLRFFVREAISVRAGRGTWRLVVGEHASHRHRGGRSANRRREVPHPLVARGPWRGAWLHVCVWVGFRGPHVGAALCRHEYGRHRDK